MNKQEDIKSDSAVSLRITSTKITSVAISGLMACSPSDSREVGDLINKRTSRRAEYAWWVLDSPCQWKEGVPEQLEKFLELVGNLPEGSWKALSDACSLEIICSLAPDDGQGSFRLNTNTIKRLAELGLAVVVQFWVTDRLWMSESLQPSGNDGGRAN
jgi:hypothetical protein